MFPGAALSKQFKEDVHGDWNAESQVNELWISAGSVYGCLLGVADAGVGVYLMACNSNGGNYNIYH